jgi:hypothetical protein
VSVYDIATGFLVSQVETGQAGMMGMDFAPASGVLHAVNAHTQTLFAIEPDTPCSNAATDPYAASNYSSPPQDQGDLCEPDSSIPDIVLFDQVHPDSGYASEDHTVQNDTMMDAAAALLALRTDCEYDSELNFDALLLGGWLCHTCLPDNCHDGGQCQAIQWAGYTCDNEFHISHTDAGWIVEEGDMTEGISLDYDRTYHFVVSGDDTSSAVSIVADSGALVLAGPVTVGKLIVSVTAGQPVPDAVVDEAGQVLFQLNVPGELPAALCYATPMVFLMVFGVLLVECLLACLPAACMTGNQELCLPLPLSAM